MSAAALAIAKGQLANDSSPTSMLTGLEALRAWDTIQPICPMCALYGKNPSDGGAPAQGQGLAPIRSVEVSKLVSPSAGAEGYVAEAAYNSPFVYVMEQTASSSDKSVESTMASLLQKKAMTAPRVPADFPVCTSHLSLSLDKQGTDTTGGNTHTNSVSSSLSHEDTTRLLTSHCYYSGTCRWSSAHHEAELLAAIEATNQRMAEGRRHRNAAAGVGGSGTEGSSAQGSSGAGGSNFAVAKMRSLVSQEKRRFQEDGFDLDLTYITKRIIAMGFPSYGKEAYYRNPAGEVERFFQQRHGDGHFRIYNLCSERIYDDEKRFNGAYRRYPFDDHNAPCPISLIADFVSDATAFLQQHRENVVAIHCKAGKGRTGLMICCLLRATESNKLRTAEEALNFFGTVRTNDGQGVTIPSQHRYVHYWDYILRNWGGVPPPRAPPKMAGAGAARLTSTSTGPQVGGTAAVSTNAGEGTGSNTNNSGVSGFYRYIYLQAIVLDSFIFVGSSMDDPSNPSSSGGAGAGATSSSNNSGGTESIVYDVSFTIEENNREIFDSRKHTLLVPSRFTPFEKMPFHAKSFLQPKPRPLPIGDSDGAADTSSSAASSAPTFGNTKSTSKDFTVSTNTRNCPLPPRGSGGVGTSPFAGYVFPLPTHDQLLHCPSSSPYRSGGVALRVAGDLRFTFYYKKQGLLGNNKESELMHFWFNTFMAQHMTEGAGEVVRLPAAGGDTSTAASRPREVRCVRLGKRELDGVHKDLRHSTYCSNIGVTVYFTIEDPFNGGEIVPAPSAKAKAMPDAVPTPTSVVYMNGQQPLSHLAPGSGGSKAPLTSTNNTVSQKDSRRTDPNAPPEGAPTTTPPPPSHSAAASQSEKKEEKSFFKNIFKF